MYAPFMKVDKFTAGSSTFAHFSNASLFASLTTAPPDKNLI